MLILGINAYHGDVAAALLRDGELVAAVEEERFRRIKHYAGFPRDAIRSCLAMAGAEAREIDAFAVSRDPKAHLWRKGLFALRHRPSTRLLRDRAANVMSVRSLARACADAMGLDESHVGSRMHYVEHHAAHLASSFFASPFEDAAVCAIDGFGDFVSTSTGVGRGQCLTIQNRVFFPHSLGLLYLAITQYLGFPKYGDEFKVMGLAPYGEPSFVDQLRQLVQVGDRGEFCLDLSYFTHWSGGMTMTWEDGEPEIGPVFTPKLEALLGPARRPQQPIEARHEALAASLQRVYEEAAFKILRALHTRVGNPRLCLAGGCAMNSVANGKVRSETPFTDLYVQPAAGDNGTALGAALYVWHQTGGARRFQMRHGYWGPQFDDGTIGAAIDVRHAADMSDAARGPASRTSSSCASGPPRVSPTGTSSAGSRGAWNGGRAHSATAASWLIPGGATCATSSTYGSSSAKSSARSRRQWRSKRSTSSSSTPSMTRS